MHHSGEITAPLHKELRDRLAGRLETEEKQVADLTRNVAGVRERQMFMSSRRLAAVQKRALSEASRP
jgi:hypothetical protein